MSSSPPGALEGYLSRATGVGIDIRDGLIRDGYVVVRGVFSRSECAEQLERMWDFVEASSGGRVCRSDARSWYPPAGPGSGPDPWPHSGWKSFSDMFQTRGAGWVFCGLRETLADRVFAPLWGTRLLHCSKEGFTFLRPTRGGLHPSAFRPLNVCGKPQPESSGEHFDQGASESGLCYVQSSTCLVDQGDTDACFLCWPGSHRMHAATVSTTYRGQRSSWVPLTGDELQTFRDSGLHPVRVPVGAGDVVLWRSDLAHAAAPPMEESSNLRAVVFAAMLPASLTPDHVLPLKRRAYEEARTGDHGANRESWHADKGLRAEGEDGFTLVPPPKLTLGQAQLHGVAPYDEELPRPPWD